MQVATVSPNCTFSPCRFRQQADVFIQLSSKRPVFRYTHEYQLSPHNSLTGRKIHYNTAESDVLTYTSNPEVLAISDGHISILKGKSPSAIFPALMSAGPGLGIEIDENKVRTASKVHIETDRAWRNPEWRGADHSLREW